MELNNSMELETTDTSDNHYVDQMMEQVKQQEQEELDRQNTFKPQFRVTLNKEFLINLMTTQQQRDDSSPKPLFVSTILDKAKAIFQKETTVMEINIENDQKITVCGDLHGNFNDLTTILDINGFPSFNNRYIFNGDFIDKGMKQIEVITNLLLLKIAYPEFIYLSRGNHETSERFISNNNSFKQVLEQKQYGPEIYQKFIELFRYLPLVYIINNKIQVNHGGLFTRGEITIDELRKIDRVVDIPERHSLMEQLLWSDPAEENGFIHSRRGLGLEFGPDITREYLKTNNLQMLVRSHEAFEDGYKFQHDGQLVTVHSASNSQYGLKGAFIVFRFNNREISLITTASYGDNCKIKIKNHPIIKID